MAPRQPDEHLRNTSRHPCRRSSAPRLRHGADDIPHVHLVIERRVEMAPAYRPQARGRGLQELAIQEPRHTEKPRKGWVGWIRQRHGAAVTEIAVSEVGFRQ